MEYELVKSSKKDINKLVDYKKKNILEYSNNLSKEEKEEINNYANITVHKYINNYQNIIIDKKVVGCILTTKEKDGILLEEIYLEEEYRSNGIGTTIINNIIKDNNIIYLWVYKMNKKAIALYKRLGFNIIDETETRYYMKYNK